MSLQAVLARISEIQGALAPVQPTHPTTPAAPATSPSTGGDSFANQLQSAMTGGGGTTDPGMTDTGMIDPSRAAAPAGTPGKQAAPGTYPHLDGDLDASPEILAKLEALAARKGMKFHINSGYRSIEEQQRLWDNRASNPLPVAQPGKSRHQSGRACDVSIGGRPIQTVISAAEIRAAGLVPLAGDAPHVELP